MAAEALQPPSYSPVRRTIGGHDEPEPPGRLRAARPPDQIVGEGYHERKGEAHAEAQALATAGPLAAGATAVATLEPCNHQGRTPPCRQSLIDAGIRRVVIAVIDPTSRGEGGVVELRRAGVDVETGVLAAEARIVLGDWLADLQTRRPVITRPEPAASSALTGTPTPHARLPVLPRILWQTAWFDLPARDVHSGIPSLPAGQDAQVAGGDRCGHQRPRGTFADAVTPSIFDRGTA